MTGRIGCCRVTPARGRRRRRSVDFAARRSMTCISRFLVAGVCCLISCWLATAAGSPPAGGDDGPTSGKSPFRPHILFVVMDDLGSGDLGLHGSGIHTPVADELATGEHGLFLSNYYVLPSCSPTRTAILSGLYPLHTGVNSYIPPKTTIGLPPGVRTLPEELGQLGYRRHAVGKWHAGHSRWDQTPTHRGFESFYGFYLGGEDYYTHKNGGGFDMRFDDRENCGVDCTRIITNETGTYSSELFARVAGRRIEEHYADDGDGDQGGDPPPLFLYLAFQAVHAPDEVPRRYLDRYANVTHWTTRRKTYAAMLTAADEALGSVVDSLKSSDMWKDTLVVYTTDNGGPTEACAVQGSSNGRRRGGKCTVWEGGTRGDGFLSGPAASRLGIGGGGRKMDHLFHCVDWLPTLLSIARGGGEIGGIEHRQSTADGAVLGDVDDGGIDGVDQYPALRGDDDAAPPRTEVYIGLTDSQVGNHGPAMRYHNWKIIEGGDGGWPDGRRDVRPPGYRNESSSTVALFDLRADPGERRDVAGDHPALVEFLRGRLESYGASGVPQQPASDPSCPEWTGFVDVPGVGPTWMPWCDVGGVTSEIVVYS